MVNNILLPTVSTTPYPLLVVIVHDANCNLRFPWEAPILAKWGKFKYTHKPKNNIQACHAYNDSTIKAICFVSRSVDVCILYVCVSFSWTCHAQSSSGCLTLGLKQVKLNWTRQTKLIYLTINFVCRGLHRVFKLAPTALQVYQIST